MVATVKEAIHPAQAVAGVQAKAADRLLFVDHLRVYLTILVLLHHLMITYAGSGSWIYMEERADTITQGIGGWFCFVNQSYFMGLFLLIAAYFVPGSYDRKGTARFLKDRFIRLGIPLAVYSWIINPLLVYGVLFVTQGFHPSFFTFYIKTYFSNGYLIGQGPLWFVETLLIFSIIYAVCRQLVKPHQVETAAVSNFPRSRTIVIFAMLLGFASFLVRLVFPVDWNFKPMNLQFPYFAQYIALFIVGSLAYYRNWLLSLPDWIGKRWLVVGLLLILAFPPLALSLSGSEEAEVLFRGGWYWQALFVAIYESLLCMSMCIGLVYAFRHYTHAQRRLAKFLIPNAYTAYLIHAPVIVAVALAIRDVALYPLLKFVLAALIAIPLCFAFSSLIRKLPYTERVL